jgi:aryl-alcohol dehydrogenase-like predicted oxidoreductase
VTIESRPLGDSGLTVSRLALGSWRTFERISRDAGLEVMRAARDAGITFLDDARYDDETGTAPMPTGYSEVVFGELFRAAGWPRDETVVTNKLWWEHWPRESATEELQGSLARMGLDHVDVIYANAPINGLELDELVASVGGLITDGLAARGPS